MTIHFNCGEWDFSNYGNDIDTSLIDLTPEGLNSPHILETMNRFSQMVEALNNLIVTIGYEGFIDNRHRWSLLTSAHGFVSHLDVHWYFKETWDMDNPTLVLSLETENFSYIELFDLINSFVVLPRTYDEELGCYAETRDVILHHPAILDFTVE